MCFPCTKAAVVGADTPECLVNSVWVRPNKRPWVNICLILCLKTIRSAWGFLWYIKPSLTYVAAVSKCVDAMLFWRCIKPFNECSAVFGAESFYESSVVVAKMLRDETTISAESGLTIFVFAWDSMEERAYFVMHSATIASDTSVFLGREGLICNLRRRALLCEYDCPVNHQYRP